MANVVRLVNGGTIQVRTGVLAGVGPEGPRGLVGPPGPDGGQGPEGPEGPIGQILQVQSRANVSAGITVNPDTDTLVSFGTVAYDDMSLFTSSTNFTCATVGDYMFSAYLGYNQPANVGDSYRHIWLQSATNGTIARTSVAAVADDMTYVLFTYPVRTTVPNEMFNLYTRSGDDLACTISAGALTVTRIGSGPIGPQGPLGPQGLVGPIGPQGIQGPPGNADDGFGTYADLL